VTNANVPSLSCLLLTLWFAANSLSAAEFGARPEWVVGETWSFRSTDASDPSADRSTELKVLSKSAQAYEVALKSSRDGERVQQYNAAMTEITKVGATPERERKFVDWPLTPGKTWTFDYYEASRRYPDRIYHYTVSAKVLGNEVVTVPAGTFDAVKIAYEGRFTRSDGGSYAKVTQTSWWAPAAARVVKTRYAETDFSYRPFSDITTELTAHVRPQ
jgi:hypothetical protein